MRLSGTPKPTDQATEEAWDRVQAVNLKGVSFGAQHAGPHLRAAGDGVTVNLPSIAGLIGAVRAAPDHPSKGAARLMSKNDAEADAADKIRVSSIHPACIWTPILENQLRATSDDLEAAKVAAGSAHPVGPMGEADDIVWAAAYLGSNEAKFVGGTEPVVDGGSTAR